MAPNTSADCRTKGYVIARSVAANGAEISSLTGAARQSLCGWVQVVNKTWRRRLELDVVISCVRRGQHWFLVDHIRRIGQTIGYRLWFDNEREIVTYWMFCYWDEQMEQDWESLCKCYVHYNWLMNIIYNKLQSPSGVFPDLFLRLRAAFAVRASRTTNNKSDISSHVGKSGFEISCDK